MNRNFLKGNTKRKEIFFKILVSSGTTLRDLKEMYNWSSQKREKKKIFGEIMATIFPKLIKNYKSRFKILNKTLSKKKKKMKTTQYSILHCTA